VEDARQYAKKVNAVLVSEITSENLLNAIEEARRRKYPELTDGATKLADLILRLS
jgi:hypothetical protein